MNLSNTPIKQMTWLNDLWLQNLKQARPIAMK